MCAKIEKEEYEGELSRTKENKRRRQLLDAVFKKPQIVFQKAGSFALYLH